MEDPRPRCCHCSINRVGATFIDVMPIPARYAWMIGGAGLGRSSGRNSLSSRSSALVDPQCNPRSFPAPHSLFERLLTGFSPLSAIGFKSLLTFEVEPFLLLNRGFERNNHTGHGPHSSIHCADR